MKIKTVWTAAKTLTSLMSTPSAPTTSLSLGWSLPYGVLKGALPDIMPMFVATVTPTLLSDGALFNFLGPILRRKELFSSNGCRVGSWGSFDLMELRDLGCFKTRTDVGVLPQYFHLGTLIAGVESNLFGRGS
jgi:hypothetical protein